MWQPAGMQAPSGVVIVSTARGHVPPLRLAWPLEPKDSSVACLLVPPDRPPFGEGAAYVAEAERSRWWIGLRRRLVFWGRKMRCLIARVGSVFAPE